MSAARRKYFDAKRGRLVYCGAAADEQFWDRHWSENDPQRILRIRAASSSCQMVVSNTRRYLGPGARVLDGGCGLADKVYALRQAGFDSHGIDYAKETVEIVNRTYPEQKVRYGDIRHIDAPDGYFHGYWSLGVIEHFYGGYDEIIEEARRIVAPGGFLFVTMPAMSVLRRLKARARMYRLWPETPQAPDDFYQFALRGEEVGSRIEGLGFRLVDRLGVNGITGLSDEFSFLRLPLKVVWKLAYRPADAILSRFSNHSELLVFERLP